MFIDFEYNGKRLSDFGCGVCNITSSSDLETKSIGSNLSFETVQQRTLNGFKPIVSQYMEAYTTTFQIGKFVCGEPEYILAEEEVRALMKWLNCRQYHKFKPIYDDAQYSSIYYNGSFNAQVISLGGDVVGMELTLQTDSPYAHYEPVSYEWTLNSDEKFTVYDYSDDYGYIYPHMEIEVLEDGQFKITNSRDRYECIINNCMAGEIITLDGENKIIQSSEIHSSLPNDFNYNFPRLIINCENEENVFTVSCPCTVRLTYSPICKVGVV